ncbi:hypothetical protein [Aurantibacter aestuarii]|uniref:Outer membrane protein beta-barrel domain-containing protein n=1 Tax=Aurantibacter aestuarii TaxID=1266046 RepID=A0A2T1N4W9_9FLAO|nr:hypothetical protein [Aurantibacter aestuarii]PSG86314.1 hypothetical protein C7H52_11510 [Aurantibacter aestuarii]
MKLFKKIMMVCVVCFAMHLTAQTSDLLRVEYLNIPNNNSKNSIQRFRGFFQLPLKINENDYFVVSGDYRTTNLEFNNNIPFETKDLENIQRIEATLGYVHRTEGDWIYAGNAGLRLASNFVGKMVSDDYIYVANVYAIRDRTRKEDVEKPSRLILGLNYTTTPGRDFPLPIINYYKEFHPNWTYTLGVPKTNVRYKIDDKNHVQTFVTLDNFHANIQKNLIVDNKLAEHISMTTILGGVGYEHYFTDHLLYYAYLAYTISNDHRLRDNDREDIYTFEDQPSVYLRTGLKFKI